MTVKPTPRKKSIYSGDTLNPRIETAEILSFRLKVPPEELARLPEKLGQELNLGVESDGGEILLSMEDSDSYLRFRPVDSDAVLTEIFLCNDDRGLFFQRVLGALMVRFRGDLHLKLKWNTPERNSHGEFAEVKIHEGSTTYPGLANSLNTLPPPVPGTPVAARRRGSAKLEEANPEGEAEVEVDRPPTAQELEIREILSRAKAHWDEYQRLKAKKG